MEKLVVFVVLVALTAGVDLIAAWMIARGLNEAHVRVGVTPVFWVVMGVSVVVQTARSKS